MPRNHGHFLEGGQFVPVTPRYSFAISKPAGYTKNVKVQIKPSNIYNHQIQRSFVKYVHVSYTKCTFITTDNVEKATCLMRIIPTK